MGKIFKYTAAWCLSLALWAVLDQEAANAASISTNASSPRGIAVQYQGDAGIERDPRVIFLENFESGSLEDLAKRWSDIKKIPGDILEYVPESPAKEGGK